MGGDPDAKELDEEYDKPKELLQLSVKTCWACLASALPQTAPQLYLLLKKMALSVSFSLITLRMMESCVLWAGLRTR